jgi:hypothetical protein
MKLELIAKPCSRHGRQGRQRVLSSVPRPLENLHNSENPSFDLGSVPLLRLKGRVKVSFQRSTPIPSRVFPMAIPREVAAEPAVVKFTRNAPSRIPGQIWYPMSSRAVSATPVGSRTAVTLGCMKASVSEAFPRRK